MGNIANMCGEDIFKKLLEEYGDDFMKLILAEKSKDVIKEKFLQLNNQSDNVCSEFEAEVNTVVDRKLESLNNSFESAKSKVDSVVPGGISTIQRLKGESVNQFSGFNKLQSKVDGIRDETLLKVQNKREEVMGDLNGKKGEMINQIEAERPKVPIYEDIPSELKTEILKKGEKQFSEQISENKDKILSLLSSKFLPESYKFLGQFFKQIDPEHPLQSIVGNAFSYFTGNMSGASGQSGGIGGLIKNIF